ncbi:MAG: hypothetical protein V4584_14115 [Verrucomicrobiota bacterium]
MDFDDPQFPDCVIGPECDEEIPEQKKLDLTPGVIRLGIISDLVGIVCELEKQADQPPLPGLRESYEKCRSFGRENRLVG